MSEISKELGDYLNEVKGIANDLKGVPEQYKSLKGRMDEVVQQIEELGQTVDILSKKGAINGGLPEDIATAPEVKALMNFVQKGVAQEQNGPTGGYLVVPTIGRRIIELQKDLDVFRQYANVMSIESNMAEVPIETTKPTTSWVGEIEQRPATNNVGIGLSNIPINALTAKVNVSQDLLADGAVVDFETWMLKQLAWGLAEAEGQAFVKGDGFKKPEGLFSSSAITQTVTTASATAITGDELIDLWGQTTSATDQNAAYYMSKSTAVKVRKLKASGTGEYLWNPALAKGMDPTINGFPLRILASAPSVQASARSVAFGDLRNTYTIIDRMSMKLLRDEVTVADNNQVKFLVTKRVGGGVVQPQSMAILVQHA